MAAAVEITRRDHAAADLRREAARCRDSDAARRMLALALVLEGRSRTDAARSCGMDRQTLRDWVHRYNRSGLDGLSDKQGRTGPKPRLSPEQETEVAELVRKGPDPKQDGVVRWRRVDVARVIQARFGRDPGRTHRRRHPAPAGVLTHLDPAAAPRGGHRGRKHLSECVQRPRDRSGARAGEGRRHPDRGLAPGRSPCWPAGHAHLRLGGEGFAAVGAEGPPLRVGVPVRRGLRRARRGRSPGSAACERRDDEPAPARDQQGRDTRSPRGAGPGRRRLAPNRRTLAGAGQHHPDASATIQPRAEPCGEHLAILATEPVEQTACSPPTPQSSTPAATLGCP